MFNRIHTVRPLPDYRLAVEFQNGEKREYDVRPLFSDGEAFKPLATLPGLFERVRVDSGGYGVSWNADIDLACDELYFNGRPNFQPLTQDA